MNPLQSNISTHHYTSSIHSSQSLEPAGSHAQAQHSPTLSLAGMSRNTLDAFGHTNQTHEPLAMRAINLIADSALSFQSAHGADAHYATANGDLTVHARLNEQSRYDVISIGSPNANSIYLSVPPPPANTRPSVSSQLATQYSRSQLTQALIQQHSPQDFSGAPLPSSASVSTQSMIFSQDGSAGSASGIPGPSRSRPAHTAPSGPYPAPSLSSRSGATSEGRSARRRGATDDEIDAHLYNPDGSLRTRQQVASALQAAGLGARNNRIHAQLQAAGGVWPIAAAAQIDAHLHNADGSLRTPQQVASALRTAGFVAGSSRIQTQLQAAGGARRSATEAQIDAHLYNPDGSLRTREEVFSALHAAGLGAGEGRIRAQLQAAGGARHLSGATEAQIDAHLYNPDGSLRTRPQVASSLHAVGLGASHDRIQAQLKALRR